MATSSAMAHNSNPGLDFTSRDEFTDVILVFDDDRKLYTSRSILAVLSPVFRRMLSSDMKEKETGEVRLPGKQLEHIQHILAWFCRFSHVQDDNVEDMIPLAHEYEIQPLLKRCEDSKYF